MSSSAAVPPEWSRSELGVGRMLCHGGVCSLVSLCLSAEVSQAGKVQSALLDVKQLSPDSCSRELREKAQRKSS